MMQQLFTREESARREISRLMVDGFNPFIPVLRFAVGAEHGEGGTAVPGGTDRPLSPSGQ